MYVSVYMRARAAQPASQQQQRDTRCFFEVRKERDDELLPPPPRRVTAFSTPLDDARDCVFFSLSLPLTAKNPSAVIYTILVTARERVIDFFVSSFVCAPRSDLQYYTVRLLVIYVHIHSVCVCLCAVLLVSFRLLFAVCQLPAVFRSLLSSLGLKKCRERERNPRDRHHK